MPRRRCYGLGRFRLFGPWTASERVPSLSEKSFRLEIFLVSLAAILLEISYTRIFSFKLFYYFTYLTIGIVLLGLGSGGIVVALVERLRRASPERVVAACSLAACLWVPLGYVFIATTQLNASDLADSPFELFTLASICFALFVPFALIGTILATIFGARPGEINRLYCADLLGAGLGCALAVPLFNLIAPPGCVMLGAAVLGFSALPLTARVLRPLVWPALAVSAVFLAGAFAGDLLPDPVPDRVKTLSPQRRGDQETLFSRWSTVFRIDVTDDADNGRHLISHDGNLGSNLIRFDGNLDTVERFERDARAIPFSVVKPEPRVLIIGAAGGHEILASLYFGAAEIVAVELNPVTTALLTDHFADFTGHLTRDPRVTLVNAEGRSFIGRDRSRYDLIWFVAPDSYAAMNAASSGAFVLSESYLYTTEMIRESLAHLNPGGVVCLQTGDIDFARKPNRAGRYLATARQAFANQTQRQPQ